MKVSLSWLNAYVPITSGVEQVAEGLTMAGLEVDTLSDRYDYLKTVLVGRIDEVSPHPNADHLKLCKVDIGGRQVQVVCGAPNAAPGILAPLALAGTELPDGTELKKSVIRDIVSEGMLCSQKELGLGTDGAGIMILDRQAIPGQNLKNFLQLTDPVMDIDLTPNRPDCLSLIGVAREVAAFQGTSLVYPDFSLSESKDVQIEDLTSVKILAPDFCPRYTARLVLDVTIGPSPFWLQDRLLSVGLRPINNIVDITNFVLMETGQPLHAFDFNRLAENRIQVRTAEAGEVFFTLDGKERKLDSEMLMICDGQKPVALAGVMGGLNSEIQDNTTRVLIESAYFDPVCIRKTAKKLGLGTEASHRFERGIDPAGTIAAADRAAELMAQLSGGRIVRGIIDAHPKPVPVRTLDLGVARTNQVLGTDLDKDRISKLLASVGFNISAQSEEDDQLRVGVPTFRPDVSRCEDLMEEVARLSGYDAIPVTFPRIPACRRRPSGRIGLRERLRDIMVGLGFNEAVNYSFTGRQTGDVLALAENDARRRMVEILNPLSEDQAVMRTELVVGLLGTMRLNFNHQMRTLKLFEVGKIFIPRPDDDLPEEIEMLAGLWTGSRYAETWHTKDDKCDFYDLKGIVEGVCRHLKLGRVRFTRLAPENCAYLRPGYSAQISIDDRPVGHIGELHPRVLKAMDLDQTGFVFEIDLEKMGPLVTDARRAEAIARFPATRRDMTLIVDKHLEADAILRYAGRSDQPLLENILLFDVYEDRPIPAGKKSVSLRLTYRSSAETLEDEAVNRIHKDLTDRIMQRFDAALPA